MPFATAASGAPTVVQVAPLSVVWKTRAHWPKVGQEAAPSAQPWASLIKVRSVAKKGEAVGEGETTVATAAGDGDRWAGPPGRP